MGTVCLIGEDHTIKSKDLVALGLLMRVRQDPLISVSVELDYNLEEQLRDGTLPMGNFKYIRDFVMGFNIPLHAVDSRDYMDYIREENVRKLLATEPTPRLLDEYKSLVETNMEIRDDYTARRIAEILGTQDGTHAHICGALHMPGLERRLSNLYSIKQYRIQKVDDKISIAGL